MLGLRFPLLSLLLQTLLRYSTLSTPGVENNANQLTRLLLRVGLHALKASLVIGAATSMTKSVAAHSFSCILVAGNLTAARGCRWSIRGR